jgi:eukaryotic-like serine/threonine-protein kinase
MEEPQSVLKMLHPELGAVLGAERFLREIHVTATLQHPHILHSPGGSHEHHGNT